MARFRLEYPGLARLLFAIPNGGRRSQREAARLKDEGVQAGVPDLMLAVPVAPFHGLFIEMKRADGKGSTSPEQRTQQELLARQGYRVETCCGYDEAWDTVAVYLAGHGKHESRPRHERGAEDQVLPRPGR